MNALRRNPVYLLSSHNFMQIFRPINQTHIDIYNRIFPRKPLCAKTEHLFGTGRIHGRQKEFILLAQKVMKDRKQGVLQFVSRIECIRKCVVFAFDFLQ